MRRKKQKTRKIIISLAIILFLAAISFCIYKFFFENKKEEVQPQNQTQTITPVAEEKDPKKTENNLPETTKKQIQKYEGENPNENEKLTGVITYAGVTADSVIVRVNIDQYTDGGLCILKLIKKNVTEYEQVSSLIADVSTSTCVGFNIAREDLTGGNYIIRIELSSDGKTGSISGELNI